MTTPTQPNTPAPAQTSAPAITPAPAPATPTTTEQAKPADPPRSLAARSAAISQHIAQQRQVPRDGAADNAEAPADVALGQATSPAAPGQPVAGEAAQAPAPSPREAHAAEVRRRAQERFAATQERARAAQPAQPPAAPAATQQAPTFADVMAAARRDPRGMAAALRDVGIDTRGLLDELTNDALAPGTARAAALAEEGTSEAKKLAERLDQLERQRAHEAAIAQASHEESEFVSTIDASKELYPALAALPPERRIEAATYVWQHLAARGVPYDRDLVAVETEAWLSRFGFGPTSAPTPAPAQAAAAAPPTSTSSPTPPAKAPAAKTPKPQRALPPDLAGQSGNAPPQPKTLHERRQAIARSLASQMRRE